MAKISRDFFNIVVIGSMNPQIMNHDWLVKHKIISRSFYVKDNPAKFNQFINMPQLAHIFYKDVDIQIHLDRFALTARTPNITKSVINIATKYFSCLNHTPIKVVGFNVNHTISFDDQNEETRFDEKYVSPNAAMKKMIGSCTSYRPGFTLFCCKNGCNYRFVCAKTPNKLTAHISHNCEYKINKTDSSDELIAFLDQKAYAIVKEMNDINEGLTAEL